MKGSPSSTTSTFSHPFKNALIRFPGMGMGKADAQHPDLVRDPEVLYRIVDVVVADPVADDAPWAVSLGEIVGGCLGDLQRLLPSF